MHNISQLPVMSEEKVVGIVNDLNILKSLDQNASGLETPVGEVMSKSLSKIQVRSDTSELIKIFEDGKVALAYDGNKFAGIITRVDVLNYLRNKQK